MNNGCVNDSEWKERQNKANEILKLLNGMSCTDAADVLDFAKSIMWRYSKVMVKEGE